MLRLAILASGGGSNLKAILDSAENGSLGNLKPVLCVIDRPCKALDIAVGADIPSVFLDRHQHGSMLSEELGRLLGRHSIDIVALAGWLSILSG
ncbi:MAG: hypothetical protein KAH21_00365, partial [Spirochaetaceae bacterium]|nr:hypothetical protein [Spirochaetaceae bacterium]